jgi:molecular chaperone GrpE
VLTNEGICPIESVGKPFDPHLHEAVLEIETSDHPEGTVIEEVRKGYLFRGNLLKPSMVKVSSIPGSNVQGRGISGSNVQGRGI